jgi:uncharacterized protein
MTALYSIAFLTGLVGSLHCVGMCGPIALALPVGGQSLLKATLSRLLYNLGRILTYSGLGLFFGYFGKAVFIAGFQQQLSIMVGILLLLSILPSHFTIIFPFQNFTNSLVSSIKKLFYIKSSFGFLLLGMANGLLPCGMVYMALAGALLSTSPLEGAVLMAIFGIGTAPLMFSISILPKFLTLNKRQKINKYLPIYTFLLSGILITRGLGLGMPFSPKIEKNSERTAIEMCHPPKN